MMNAPILTAALCLLVAGAFVDRAAYADNGGSGSGVGGTGVDSAVQSYGEASNKTAGGLVRGLESAFSGLTIEEGLSVGDVLAPDLALLGDDQANGDVVLFTVSDSGRSVIVFIRNSKIASIELSAPLTPVAPSANACG